MPVSLDLDRLNRCYRQVRSALLGARSASGHWVGELSASALSTATAVMALHVVRRKAQAPAASVANERETLSGRHGPGAHATASGASAAYAHEALSGAAASRLLDRGLRWLAEHQNPDGGWGDTTKSRSNLSTTMLANAAFHAVGVAESYAEVVRRAETWIEGTGGVPALLRRYGKDRTFSIPILTQCALAGMVDWSEVVPLPFELACVPHRFYKTVRLPVVSYALPALIAIGQARHFHRPPRNPLTRLIRKCATGHTLRILERIQPSNGGFLEATPLTSFVTMSLASIDLWDHPVAVKGAEFLVRSVREDGSWPIDTNLATWLTTLSVNALGGEIAETDGRTVKEWLLRQQFKDIHPYTHAAPGSWAWTNLPGGVPDADDTAGAILALLKLSSAGTFTAGEACAAANGVHWLLELQNSDRGWPTFCRGWGTLPFDRSAADITAHVLRALTAWLAHPAMATAPARLRQRASRAIGSGFQFLERSQRQDGTWIPLWFGNEHVEGEENPVYGTARVLAAYRDAHRIDSPAARRAMSWLVSSQNPDGGWGGAAGVASTVEETALATESLLADQRLRMGVWGRVCEPPGLATRNHNAWGLADSTPDTPIGEIDPSQFLSDVALGGLNWLLDRIESGSVVESAPIGFYFAKLWYFERLYPLVFAVSALRCATVRLGRDRYQEMEHNVEHSAVCR